MTEALSIPGLPVWMVAVFGALWFFLQFTDRAAKIPLFGRAARRWSQRRELAVGRNSSLDKRINDAVRQGVEQRMATVNRSIEAMRRQITQLQDDLETERRQRRSERDSMLAQHREELREVQAERDSLLDYIAALSAIFHRIRIDLSGRGVELRESIPSFEQWNKNKGAEE